MKAKRGGHEGCRLVKGKSRIQRRKRNLPKEKRKQFPAVIFWSQTHLSNTMQKQCSSKGSFCFQERTSYVIARDEYVPLQLENIGHSTLYVYAVRNMGSVPAEVKIQVGPNRQSLAHDIGPEQIPAYRTKIVTPLRFSKYIRLLYRSVVPGQKTKLQIVFQSQTHR